MRARIQRWRSVGFMGGFLLGLAALATAAEQEVTAPAAELKIANRSIMTFRANWLGETQTGRVLRAELVINEVLDSSHDAQVRLDAVQDNFPGAAG